MRTLSFEAGRKWGLRVNAISAGPMPSRAANAIGGIEQMIEHCMAVSPLPEAIVASEVAVAASFLSCPLASGITGTTLYVDKGYHAMGIGSPAAPHVGPCEDFTLVST
jgi:enoyl-[acyl-carrier protein] reductase I